MRMFTIALGGVAAALMATGAHAIDVSQSMKVSGTPEEVWKKVGDFCAIADWHPAVATCERSEEGGTTYRTLALEGGGTIRERLVETTPTGYTYEIVESPLPVAKYRSTFGVSSTGGETMVDWKGTFDAKDSSDADAEGVIAGIYKAGLDEIGKMGAK